MARKRREGVAVADARHKTVSVRVERTVTHPLYRKVQRRRKRYLAHDETNECKIGDRVLIEECRPLSKRKSWRVVQILERREVAEVQPAEIGAPVIEPEPSEQPPAEQPAEVAPSAEAAPIPAAAVETQAPAPVAEPTPEEPATAEATVEAEATPAETQAPAPAAEPVPESPAAAEAAVEVPADGTGDAPEQGGAA